MQGEMSRMAVEQGRREFEMDRQSNVPDIEDSIPLDGGYSYKSAHKTEWGETSTQDAQIEARQQGVWTASYSGSLSLEFPLDSVDEMVRQQAKQIIIVENVVLDSRHR